MGQPAVKGAERPRGSASDVLASKEFKALVAKRWTVSLVLLVVLFVSYYGFILVIAGAPEFVNQKVGEVTTLAIPMGIAAIVVAWVLTALYVAWANKSYDPEVERLKSQLKH